MEKVTGIGGLFFRAHESESIGALVPATPGDLPHTTELRGFRVAARGRTHRFRSSSDYFGDLVPDAPRDTTA
jgi:hypothetical protein